ncbi:MAG: adenosine kinase [Planctomycetota bacterium]|nr:MAG: adenosine kinase [Planctomycetota bacterium]
MSQELDVVAIGNALVDVLSHADDDFLKRHGVGKGTMCLIGPEKAEQLYSEMGPAVEISGGSAANTVAGLASLGGKAAFIGKVADDQLGAIFRHDIRAQGVVFESKPAPKGGAPTGRCMIIVTPDAQRTMQTCLGSAGNVAPADVDENLIQRAKVTYLEGYLWDTPLAKKAYIRAAELAHAAGRKVALTLSDKFCVDRHLRDFQDLVEGHIDILFANEEEIKALCEVKSFDAALPAIKGKCDIAVLTRSEKGAVIVHSGAPVTVAAEPVAKLVDTTGAGDLFAAGFLFGYTRGMDLARCGRIAAICAAEVISHVGARPEVSLSAFVEQRL